MGMFDNYNINSMWSDNLVLFLNVSEEPWDTIVRGATNTHHFKLPVEISDIKNYKVSYKQGLSVILEKSFGECEFEEVGEYIYLKCTLTPEESRLFNFYNRDTFIQLAIQLQDDTAVYSDVYRLLMIDSINDSAFEESSEGV